MTKVHSPVSPSICNSRQFSSFSIFPSHPNGYWQSWFLRYIRFSILWRDDTHFRRCLKPGHRHSTLISNVRSNGPKTTWSLAALIRGGRINAPVITVQIYTEYKFSSNWVPACTSVPADHLLLWWPQEIGNKPQVILFFC